jgi:hypothetical protein
MRSGLLPGAQTRRRQRLAGPVHAAVFLPGASTRRCLCTRGKYAQAPPYPGLQRAVGSAVRGKYAREFFYQGPVRASGATLVPPERSRRPSLFLPLRVPAPGNNAGDGTHNRAGDGAHNSARDGRSRNPLATVDTGILARRIPRCWGSGHGRGHGACCAEHPPHRTGP